MKAKYNSKVCRHNCEGEIPSRLFTDGLHIDNRIGRHMVVVIQLWKKKLVNSKAKERTTKMSQSSIEI